MINASNSTCRCYGVGITCPRWQECCSYRSSLSEALECGWSRELEKQIVQEARKVDIAGHGYWLDQESHIPWQAWLSPHPVVCLLICESCLFFQKHYGLIVKNSNIKNWTCNLAIKWIIFLKQRGIFLVVQWLRPKTNKQTRKPETRVRNTHHFLVIL